MGPKDWEAIRAAQEARTRGWWGFIQAELLPLKKRKYKKLKVWQKTTNPRAYLIVHEWYVISSNTYSTGTYRTFTGQRKNRVAKAAAKQKSKHKNPFIQQLNERADRRKMWAR